MLLKRRRSVYDARQRRERTQHTRETLAQHVGASVVGPIEEARAIAFVEERVRVGRGPAGERRRPRPAAEEVDDRRTTCEQRSGRADSRRAGEVCQCPDRRAVLAGEWRHRRSRVGEASLERRADAAEPSHVKERRQRAAWATHRGQFDAREPALRRGLAPGRH